MKILKTYISIVLPIGSWLPSQAPIAPLKEELRLYTLQSFSLGKPVCTESRAARDSCTGQWSGQEPLGTPCCYSTRE